MKKDAKKRAALLKRLREEHSDTVERTRALLKENKSLRRKICQATREAPKPVPEIAQMTGIPADRVLWHITAMKKYGDVVEAGNCGEYYLYQAVKEKRS
jgi:hypothetical protein